MSLEIFLFNGPMGGLTHLAWQLDGSRPRMWHVGRYDLARYYDQANAGQA
jgi:hypothetical protein